MHHALYVTRRSLTVPEHPVANPFADEFAPRALRSVPAPSGREAAAPLAPEPEKLQPLSFDERSANQLRPSTFDGMVGQPRVKRFMRRIIANAQTTGRPLDHMLLAGQSGTGKTTLAQVVAHEMGRRVFQVAAPVDRAMFEKLRVSCEDGDVVIVDEIHQQVSGDRRGVTQAADPETFFAVMEDRRLNTPAGIVPFPCVTFIGCTTDTGLLPEPFLNRFPLRPMLDHYTVEEMATLAERNATAIGMTISPEAALIFGRAARRTPRQLNSYIKNARSLADAHINADLAREVVVDLNSTTLDGLNGDMTKMLLFLLSSRRESRDGHVVYQASVNTVATALGKSRDTKAIALYTEPWLIEAGFVAVTHGGRMLTEAGIARAREL